MCLFLCWELHGWHMQQFLHVYIFYLNENLLHSFTLSIENGESFIIFSKWGALENT